MGVAASLKVPDPERRVRLSLTSGTSVTWAFAMSANNPPGSIRE